MFYFLEGLMSQSRIKTGFNWLNKLVLSITSCVTFRFRKELAEKDYECS